MNLFQRIKSFAAGIFYLLIALALALTPNSSLDSIYWIISIMMLLYGARLLWYYFSMARQMVGGKVILYQAIIVLDAALFTMSLASLEDYIVLIYLLGIYAFSGAIDILRAFEAKKNTSPVWKKKIIIGFAEAGFAVVLVVLAVILRNTDILVYGFAVSLASTAVLKIYDAVRETAIVYIQ